MTLLMEPVTGRHEVEAFDASERRRGLRIRQDRPIKVFEPVTARYFGGQTRDISATGLRIELPPSAALRPGRLLNVHVGLDSAGHSLANRRQMIPARIVWIRPPTAQAPTRVMAGIEFLSSIAARMDAA
jgi:hypothetical protein